MMINKNRLIPIVWAFLFAVFPLASHASGTPPNNARAYGILPFVKTLSRQTNLSMRYDDFEKVLQNTLSQVPDAVKVQSLTGEKPLDYFTGDFSQRVEANQRLHQLSQAQKLDGLILGNIQESAGQDALELSVIAYFASKEASQAFLAFYHERIKYNGPPQPPQKKTYADILLLLGGSDLSQQPLQPEQLAKPVKHWLTKLDSIMHQAVSATNAQSGQPQQGPFGPQKIVFLPGETKTLKEIYSMLYEQEFYVHTQSSDEAILQEIAQEKGMGLSQFKEALTQHWRQRKYLADKDACEMRGLVSIPENNKSGIVYKLCFEPSYLETSQWRCPPIGTPAKVTGKRKEMTHEEATQELAQLNANSQFKDWRLPTIDELFAMRSLLPEPSVGEPPLTFWSATAKTQQTWWGLSTEVISVRNIAKVYRTYVTDLHDKGSAFVLPVRNCPQLSYPYIWQ
ncbi:MAG: hypothetical protein VSS75_013970 [Candidatus Parabeggiatoa sp.]|nr:hypothetical protein [Candidatus Parabeggiatoa sp.]